MLTNYVMTKMLERDFRCYFFSDVCLNFNAILDWNEKYWYLVNILSKLLLKIIIKTYCWQKPKLG